MHTRLGASKAVVLGLALAAAAGCGGAVSDGGGSDEDALSTGGGLAATYFSDVNLGTSFKTRTDAQVAFDWGTGAPMSGLSADDFSVRWVGFVTPTKSGTYTFTTTSDDGVRLWVNGQELVNNWTRHAAVNDSGSIALTAGRAYSLKLEYYENTGKAVMKLSWTPPGGASVLVPSSALSVSAGTPPSSGVAVSGNHLVRDGKTWLPKGLSMIGSLSCGSANQAYSHWGQAELDAAKKWGADALRFQVSQPLLDPQSSKYQSAYLTKLKSMVALAQANGFAVILSMQDQSLACGNADPLPTASTQRAWAQLAPVFASNKNVIYELYNEPQNAPTTTGWDQWKNGSGGTVGHQALLTQLRNAGSQNVILADGANHAEILTGVPTLSDPLNNYGYASHPYYLAALNNDASAWDDRFGTLSQTHAVLVTEWNQQTSSSCASNSPALVSKFFPYLKAHQMGVFAWSFDLPDTLVLDWNWTPTNFDSWTCGQGHNGVGQALINYWNS